MLSVCVGVATCDLVCEGVTSTDTVPLWVVLQLSAWLGVDDRDGDGDIETSVRLALIIRDTVADGVGLDACVISGDIAWLTELV
jgi:hypothetical protein